MSQINQLESKFLFGKKTKIEKKTYLQANEEIKRDKEFVKETSRNLKGLLKENKELKGKIIKLEKEREEIKRKWRELRKKEFNKGFERHNESNISIKYCSRVLTYLEENPNSNLTKISKDCGFKGGKVLKPVLGFLLRYNLITKSPNKFGLFDIYNLNKEEK